MIEFDGIHASVFEEEQRQLEIWGEQRHPDGTSVENKEIADLARKSCNDAFEAHTGTWFDILLEEVMEAGAEEDVYRLDVELMQIAAVANSWRRAIARRPGSPTSEVLQP